MTRLHEPMLYLICGKIAAGKSTLTAQLGRRAQTVVISQDTWLAELFGEIMSTPRDYVACAAKLDRVIYPHVTHLLGAGLSVVLDFPANTVAQRQSLRALADQSGVPHELHVLDVPDAVCLARLQARNAQGEHPFAVTEAQFHQVTRHFELPTEAEGFTTIVHRYDAMTERD